MERQFDQEDAEYDRYETIGQEEAIDEQISHSEVVNQSQHQDEEYEENFQQEEEIPEEEPKKRSGRDSGSRRIQELTRERYQTQAELNRLREEYENLHRRNQELQHMAGESTDAAMVHYESSAQLKLSQAKAKKEKALEDMNIQAQVDADLEVAEALNELSKIKEYKYRQKYEYEKEQSEQYQPKEASNNQQEAQHQAYVAAAQQNIMSWVNRNPWTSERSNEYDEERAYKAREYWNELENYCYRAGQPYAIGSDAFLAEMDNYVRSLGNGGNMQRKQLSMRPGQSAVSPVRAGTTSSQQPKRVELSAAEKEIARNFGISNEEYLKHKISDQKTYSSDRRSQGRRF